MLRMAGMKKIWTLFYALTLFNIFLTLKALMPVLMPDEVVQDRLNLISFIRPFLHPQAMNIWFILYWIVNGVYLYLYGKMHVRIAAHFNKSTAFGWGLALLEPVFYPILAFGKATYQKEEATSVPRL